MDGIKVCMFDQYGTVVDMQGGLTEVAAPFLQSKGWKGKPGSVRHVVAAHAFRELDDRRAAAPRAHALPRDRPPRGGAGDGPRRHPAHEDEVRDLVAAIEKLKPFPEVPAALARLQTRYKLVVLSNGDPDMLETAQGASRHSVRRGDLRRRSERVQAARRDLHQGGRDPGRAAGADPLRREPRLRLHRREVGRHAHGLHQPSPAPVRPLRRTSPTSSSQAWPELAERIA